MASDLSTLSFKDRKLTNDNPKFNPDLCLSWDYLSWQLDEEWPARFWIWQGVFVVNQLSIKCAEPSHLGEYWGYEF